MKLNAKIIFAFIFLLQPLLIYAQEESAPPPKRAVRNFSPVSKRDPFLSREEVASIEAARQAEIKRLEDERKQLEMQEKARLAEEERLRKIAEELAKNPARAIINKIRIDGFVGNEAIINGQFKSVGDSVLGAKITKITQSNITFIYKGQTFTKKMPA